ncbi:hypothetical protein JCM19237_5047 [Photobacterium aphoticum]|uniref:Uncharacterized protein n=1 Tax=Photobacterium aphoticum TaxID=754436 RepID=A0A090QK17_9GAMM|nr:hypothetical protein JCM19237_5047 [Photobacterium aphoticum]
MSGISLNNVTVIDQKAIKKTGIFSQNTATSCPNLLKTT